MRKVEAIVARTPEELAGNLGLSSAAAKEWQVQHMLLKRLKEIARHRANRERVKNTSGRGERKRRSAGSCAELAQVAGSPLGHRVATPDMLMVDYLPSI
jgi:hypothetical protein